MKLSNLISKFHQTFARVLLAFNLFESLFPHHTAKLKQNHQVNLKNSEPTKSSALNDMITSTTANSQPLDTQFSPRPIWFAAYGRH